MSGERVVTNFRYITRGHADGLTFETQIGAIHRFKDRKIVRADFCRSAGDALEAAGVNE